MNFNWIVSDIEEKLKHSMTFSTNNTKTTIYSKMLSDLNNNKMHTVSKISRDVFFENLMYFDLKCFDNPFFKLISYIAANLKEYDLMINSPTQEKKNHSHTIKLCKDFYKKNDKDSALYFKKIIKTPGIFQFMYNPNNLFLGRTYILSSDEYYILINGKNYLEDSLSTIHETKHVEMAIKGYNKGISLYQELPSILYELYMIDYLSTIDDNKMEVLRLRLCNLNKYLENIKKIDEQIKLIKNLKKDNDIHNLYQNLYENYDLYYDEYNLYELNDILINGFSQKETGAIISFIVAIDIYLNSRMSNVNNVLSCYIFGVYKMKPSMIDGILEYITSTFRPYEKINKKIKNGIDKY